jgi:LysM repeat protein
MFTKRFQRQMSPHLVAVFCGLLLLLTGCATHSTSVLKPVVEPVPVATGAADTAQEDALHSALNALAAKAAKVSEATTPFTLYTVQAGDTLGSIAQHFLGDVGLWRYVAAVNPWLTDPNNIAPGQVISLPPASAGTAYPTDSVPAPTPSTVQGGAVGGSASDIDCILIDGSITCHCRGGGEWDLTSQPCWPQP